MLKLVFLTKPNYFSHHHYFQSPYTWYICIFSVHLLTLTVDHVDYSLSNNYSTCPILKYCTSGIYLRKPNIINAHGLTFPITHLSWESKILLWASYTSILLSPLQVEIPRILVCVGQMDIWGPYKMLIFLGSTENCECQILFVIIMRYESVILLNQAIIRPFNYHLNLQKHSVPNLAKKSCKPPFLSSFLGCNTLWVERFEPVCDV